MEAGKLRSRIQIQEPVTAQDDVGQAISTWMSRMEAWAHIEPLRGRERISGGAQQSEMDTRITFKWTPKAAQIRPTWRVVHEAGGVVTIYNIKSVANVDMRNREAELMCSSGLTES